MTEFKSKLFLVTCKGMTYNTTGTPHGIAYVIADNPNDAYKKLRTYLDEKNLGFSHEREMHTIELIAEAYEYTDSRKLLFI